MNARKIATSLPATQFQALERTRRRLRMKRSEAVQEALTLWLSARQGDERVRLYLQGYVNQPEDKAESVALATAFADGMEPEDW